MDYRTIYERHAAEYDALVSHEDRGRNLERRLREIRDPSGLDVVELGAGTGRVTRILASGARLVRAFDGAAAMIHFAKQRFLDAPHVELAVADNRALPVESSSADLAVAGWTFGHQIAWSDDWRRDVGAMVGEMLRVLRPGGVAIVIETLGTLREEPAPPSPGLAEYYEWLEREHGFAASSIRTDYEFDSLDEAARVMGFFFGDEMRARVRAHGSPIVPECTGVWSRR